LADELVERAESEPKSPTIKGDLNKVEDTLREQLGDVIVDATLKEVGIEVD